MNMHAILKDALDKIADERGYVRAEPKEIADAIEGAVLDAMQEWADEVRGKFQVSHENETAFAEHFGLPLPAPLPPLPEMVSSGDLIGDYNRVHMLEPLTNCDPGDEDDDTRADDFKREHMERDEDGN